MIITWIGEIYRVQLESGAVYETTPTIFGIDPEFGIVVAETRAELAEGIVYSRPPRLHRRPLARFWYSRHRVDSDDWFHDSPGAGVVLFQDRGGVRPWIDSQGAEVCNQPGDYVCGA